MPTPTEHKSVQVRILKYADEIDWAVVSRSEAEQRRGFYPSGASPREKAKHASRFFTDILFEKVKEFNPKFRDSKEELLRKLDLPLPTIEGNREFLGPVTIWCTKNLTETSSNTDECQKSPQVHLPDYH